MDEALTVYMRASLLARNTERMEFWTPEDLVLAFHCRDNPTFAVFCQRAGIVIRDEETENAELSKNAESCLSIAKLLSKHDATKNIVKIEEVKPNRKAKRA